MSRMPYVSSSCPDLVTKPGGCTYEAGRLHLDALNRAASFEHELSAARVNEIVSELAGYHSMYSVLKYKAFKLYKQNQRLEFNNAGLRAQEVMWNEWADRMRRERETRDAETLRLRSLLSEFSLDWAAEGGPALPPGLIKAAQMPDVLQDDPPAEEPAALEPQVSSASPIEPMTGLWTRVLRFLKLR
jgi:hypothetical protein